MIGKTYRIFFYTALEYMFLFGFYSGLYLGLTLYVWSLFVGVSAAILGRRYVDYKAAVACLVVLCIPVLFYFVVAVYRPRFFALPYLLFPFAADFRPGRMYSACNKKPWR